jgi:hypothetical protein
VRLAGKYENDPHYDEVLAHIEEYRRELDAETQGKRILTGTKNMLQLNLTKFPCILLYFMDAINGKRF